MIVKVRIAQDLITHSTEGAAYVCAIVMSLSIDSFDLAFIGAVSMMANSNPFMQTLLCV